MLCVGCDIVSRVSSEYCGLTNMQNIRQTKRKYGPKLEQKVQVIIFSFVLCCNPVPVMEIEMIIDDIADGKLFFLTVKKQEEDQPNAKVNNDNFEARFEDFKFDRIVFAGLVDPFVSKTLWTFEQRRNLFLSGLALQQLLQRLLTCRRISADQTDRLQILLSFGRRLRVCQQRTSLQQPFSVCSDV